MDMEFARGLFGGEDDEDDLLGFGASWRSSETSSGGRSRPPGGVDVAAELAASSKPGDGYYSVWWRTGVPGGQGGLPSLERLHLEGCEGIEVLQLYHANLRVLQVMGCKWLSRVVVAAPQLGTLALEDIGALKEVWLQVSV
jgi:hypothetical protein